MAKVSQIRSQGKSLASQSGGKLLATTKESPSAIRIDRDAIPGSIGDQMYLRAISFKRAADLIADAATDAGVDRWTIYPSLFLYRHYVEVMLKSIILEGRSSSIPPEDPISTHDLLKLWKRVKPTLSRICPTIIMQRVDDAERRIKELHNLDETSMVFRYPIDNRLCTWSQPPLVLDFSKLRREMDNIHNFLWSVAELTSQWVEYKNDCSEW